MAKYRKKVKNNRNYIRVKLFRNEKLNEGELDFFARQSIYGLYKAKKIRGNRIEFYGPEGISLAERLRKPISKHDFFFLLELVVKFTCDISASTLSINKVVFDLNQVYINEKTNELWFLYLPLNEYRGDVNIVSFMESMIYASTPIAEQDTAYMSRLIFFLRNLAVYDAKKIEQYIQNEDRTVVNQIRQGYQQADLMDVQKKAEDYQDYYKQSGRSVDNSYGGNGYQGHAEMNVSYQDEKMSNNTQSKIYEDKNDATGLLDEGATGLL